MEIRSATVTIRGISTYSPSAMVRPIDRRKESGEQYEEEVWRDRAHYNAEGNVIIPFMAFKKSIASAASLTKRKVVGAGNQTFSAIFKSGVLLDEPLVLDTTRDTLVGQHFMCSADGDARGVGARVSRKFPMIGEWGGKLTYHLLNSQISKSIFEQYLEESGMLIGVGRFRPENGGVCGRFEVVKMTWA